MEKSSYSSIIWNTTSSPNLDGAVYYGMDLYIGLVLSTLSAVFIGSSFIIKKKSLISLSQSGGVRAGSGGHAYLCHWVWWLGLISMGLGEAFNFIAYAFAPATLVTPLGALSVLVTAVLSAIFLGEVLNLLGKIGCALCILGSTVIVIHAPKEEEVSSMAELEDKFLNPVFLIYVILVTTVSIVLILYCSAKYGSKNVVIYISICSLIGGFSVLACKSLGLAIKETLNGRNELSNWLTWVSFLSLIICICIQMNYLNKALDIFNTSVVTPVYYVFFTTCVIVSSGVLFREWESMSAEDILGVISGFLTIILAIFLLQAFKDVNLSLRSVVTGEEQRTNINTIESRTPLLFSSIRDDEEDGLISWDFRGQTLSNKREK